MSGQSEVIVGLLRQVHLFSELSEGELGQIAGAAATLRRTKNQIIFDEGDSADCLLVLTKGRAKVVLVGDGAEEIILNLIEPFRVVGEIALLDRSTRSARLVAVEDCQFIKLPVTSFDALRTSNAVFAGKIRYAARVQRSAQSDLHVPFARESRVVSRPSGAAKRADQGIERNTGPLSEA
jgi:CRP-like cAMP-binding protein